MQIGRIGFCGRLCTDGGVPTDNAAPVMSHALRTLARVLFLLAPDEHLLLCRSILLGDVLKAENRLRACLYVRACLCGQEALD